MGTTTTYPAIGSRLNANELAAIRSDTAAMRPYSSKLGYHMMTGEAVVDFVSASWGFVASGAGGGSWSTASPLLFARAAVLQPENVAGANARVRLATGVSLTIDSSDTFLVVCDSLSGLSNNDQIRLAFSSDGLTVKSAYMAHVSKLAHGSRAYFLFRASDITLGGGEALTNTMNYVEVRYTSSAGGGSVRVLGVYRNGRARPKCIIDFDDGKLPVYQYAAPIMAKYGLIGNMAIITGVLGTAGYMTTTQVGDLYNSGWDVMTHGNTGHTAFANRAALLADVIANRDYITGQSWTRDGCYQHYVLPGGLWSPTANNDTWGVLAETGMVSARLVDPNAQPTHLLGIDCAYGLWSRSISQTTTVATCLDDVDRAISTGGTVRLHGHSVVKTVSDAANEMSITDFDSLCSGIADRINSGKIDNVSITNWWRNLRIVGTN